MVAYVHNGGTPAVGQHPSNLKGVRVFSFFLQNGQIKTAAGSAVTLVNGDTLDPMTFPIGSVCIGAGVFISTAFAASSTVSVGDSSSATRWLSAQSLAAVGHLTNNTMFGYSTAGVTARLTFAGANPGTTGVAHFYWLVADATDAANVTTIRVT